MKHLDQPSGSRLPKRSLNFEVFNIMKHKVIFLSRIVCLLAGLLTVCTFAFAQTFRPVGGWPDSVNSKLEDFLNSTLVIRERKVAVFDCDGTLFGQAPHYLADEALYSYAKKHYAGKKDRTST